MSAVEQRNRTSRTPFERHSTGFEDRAGHQAQWLYRDRDSHPSQKLRTEEFRDLVDNRQTGRKLALHRAEC